MTQPLTPGPGEPLTHDGFNREQMAAIRLLKARYRLVAVEQVFRWPDGYASKLRAIAFDRGHRFPRQSRSTEPLSLREYERACRAAGRAPTPDLIPRLRNAVAADEAAKVWPHLKTYPPVGQPRNSAAAAQAGRILARTKHMRHVPASFAGGGLYHFGRECAEHLAQLIAYAPGPRYPDDPRAAQREPRFVPDFREVFSITPSALGQFAETAA